MQALKKSALNGSLDALEKIIHKVTNNEDALVLFLPTFSRLLQSTRIPDGNSSDDDKHRFLIITRQTFHAVAIGMSDSPASNQALVAALTFNLPDMCDFAIAFFRLFVLDVTSLSPSDVELAREMKETVFPGAFYGIFAIPSAFAVASSHTGLFDCLTRVWVLVATERQPPPVVDQYLAIVLGLGERFGQKSPGMDEFRNALEQLPSALIVTCTLQRIINDLHTTPIDVQIVRQNMYRACLASHIAKWCCVIMKRLMSRKHVLPAGCEQTVTRIVDAMEHGFMDCVFRCQPLLDYQEISQSQIGKSLGSAFAEQVDLFNAFTVHRQVLRASHRAVKKVLYMNLEDNIEKEGPLWDAWERFRDIVDERWQAKEDYIQAGPKDWCDNEPLCACAFSYYCSRTCQRAAWKTGHKETCQAQQKAIKEGAPIPTTQRDIQFFFAMAEGDYNFHSDQINKLTNDFLRACRSTSVLPSPKVTITTADKIPKRGDWEGIVEKGRMNFGRLVYLTVQDNGKPFQVFGVIDEPR
ncbi:hypothetical protein CPB85DRAFT_1340553 [Mucidula mucida]|nr:hypothetical protein CPB85DRAFT_1340553 [Mucidula mucida]